MSKKKLSSIEGGGRLGSSSFSPLVFLFLCVGDGWVPGGPYCIFSGMLNSFPPPSFFYVVDVRRRRFKVARRCEEKFPNEKAFQHRVSIPPKSAVVFAGLSTILFDEVDCLQRYRGFGQKRLLGNRRGEVEGVILILWRRSGALFVSGGDTAAKYWPNGNARWI
jgi:hypothetical protein